jgi:drug/metabolite transporter (DMT)-like permease
MNTIRLLAIILLVVGVLAFIVPVPHHEDHSVKVGDTKLGVETTHNEKVPPAIGIVLIAGGVVALAVSARKP